MYINYINDEISFVDLKSIYLSSITSAEKETNSYFTEEEQTESNEAWKGAIQAVNNFETKINGAEINPASGQYTFNDTIYSSLIDMQKKMNEAQAEILNIELNWKINCPILKQSCRKLSIQPKDYICN